MRLVKLLILLVVACPLTSDAQVITETSSRLTRAVQRDRDARRKALEDQIALNARILEAARPVGNEARPAGADAAAGVAELTIKAATEKLGELKAEETAAVDHATFLTQAGFTAGTTDPEIGVQVADLFFAKDFRLFIRATLPTKPDSNETEVATGTGSSAAGAATPESLLNDRIRSALLDPYGGLLYLSGGYLTRVLPAANDDDGLFVDARLGAKFVQLEDTEEQEAFSAAPFLVGSVGFRLQRRLFFNQALDDEAGTFVLGVTGVVNRVIDASKSSLFTADENGVSPLPHAVGSLNVSVGIRLPKLVAITVSATPWSSADTEKQFMVGFNLFSKQ